MEHPARPYKNESNIPAPALTTQPTNKKKRKKEYHACSALNRGSSFYTPTMGGKAVPTKRRVKGGGSGGFRGANLDSCNTAERADSQM